LTGAALEAAIMSQVASQFPGHVIRETAA